MYETVRKLVRLQENQHPIDGSGFYDHFCSYSGWYRRVRAPLKGKCLGSSLIINFITSRCCLLTYFEGKP